MQWPPIALRVTYMIIHLNVFGRWSKKIWISISLQNSNASICIDQTICLWSVIIDQQAGPLWSCGELRQYVSIVLSCPNDAVFGKCVDIILIHILSKQLDIFACVGIYGRVVNPVNMYSPWSPAKMMHFRCITFWGSWKNMGLETKVMAPRHRSIDKLSCLADRRTDDWRYS